MTGLFQCKPIDPRWKKFKKILFAGKFANKLFGGSKGLLTMWDLVGAWVERRQNIINTAETHWHQTDWSVLGKQLMREL